MSHSEENKPEATEQQDGNNLVDQFFSSQGTTIPSDFKSGFVCNCLVAQMWVSQL